MQKKKWLNKIPFGIIFSVSLMVISLLVAAIITLNIVSSEMIKSVGTDDGISQSWYFKLLYVLTILIAVVAIAAFVFLIIRAVINKKNNIKKENKYRSVFASISGYVLVLFVVSLIAGSVLDVYKKQVNSALGLAGYRTETIQTDEEQDLEYYKSKYIKKDSNGQPIYKTESNGYKHLEYDDAALVKDALKKADQVQREGTTILWNSNGLPLAKNNKVSLLSHSSVDWVHSGGGSGYAYTSGAADLKTALTNAGLSVNTTLWNFYKSGDGKSYTRTARYLMNEVPWSKYTSSVTSSFSSFGDAAIITLSRKAGEGSVAQGGAFDVTTTEADTPSGDYYDMSNEERTLLNEVINLKNNGTFKKIIVLLNTPTGMWFENLLAHKNDIDACVWVCQTGFEGLNEVGKILVGDSNPSGHLVDTFLYNTQADPAFINSIFSYYSNANSIGLKDLNKQGTFIAYLENIYVGYKYYETRYEDAVLNQGNATSLAGVKASTSDWKYSEEVAFPFGWGESYTSFAYSDFNVSQNADGDYIVSLKVKNTGLTSGKDAVQVYLQKPYTQYDKDNNIEQASVNLVGYHKTKELKSGESCDVSITVKAEEFKTYDANNKKTYIREKTNGINAYYLTASSDAHAAINNILAAKGKTPLNSSGIMDHEGNSSFVQKIEFNNDDFTTYSKSLTTNYPITNQFDDTDWNKYGHKSENNVTYLSRNNWRDTYPTSTPTLSLNADMVYDLSWDKEVEKNPNDKMPTFGQQGGLNLIDMKGLEFDNPSWNELLNSLTLDELIEFIGKAYHGTNPLLSIGKPGDVVEDGPLGIRKQHLGKKSRTLSYPCTPLLAATYNDELVHEVGELMGEDMLHAGVNGLYGPGANIHRTTYAGRNYEYYSEDGFLSGRMLKQHVSGIQSTGCYVNIKHIALNDQESNRYGVGIWANEQSIREIYLPAFEYSVREGDCTGLMSAFNRFGTLWSGAHKGLCTNVLRNEWGFKGFVISDCAWREYMGVVDGLMAGNDCILYGETILTEYYKAKTNPTIAIAIREAAHRMLYVIANSNIMNGISSNTRIYFVNEWWQNLILGVQIGLGTLSGLLIIATVLIFVFHKKISKKYDERIERLALEKQNDPTHNRFERLLCIGKPWNVKRILITILTGSISLGVLTGFFFIGFAVGGANNKGSDTPIDGGEGSDTPTTIQDLLPDTYNTLRIEAEHAEITDPAGTILMGAEGKSLTDTNYPSNNRFVYGLNKASQDGTTNLVFKFNSNSSGLAVLSFGLGLNTERSLEEMWTVELNNQVQTIFDKNIKCPATSSDKYKYYNWTKISAYALNVNAGQNVLKLTLGKLPLNFDYIELDSALTLSEVGKYFDVTYNDPWDSSKVDGANAIAGVVSGTTQDLARATKSPTYTSYYYQNTKNATFTTVVNSTEADNADLYLMWLGNTGASEIGKTDGKKINDMIPTLQVNGSSISVSATVCKRTEWNETGLTTSLMAKIPLVVGSNTITFTRDTTNINLCGLVFVSTSTTNIISLKLK